LVSYWREHPVHAFLITLVAVTLATGLIWAYEYNGRLEAPVPFTPHQEAPARQSDRTVSPSDGRPVEPPGPVPVRRR